MRRVLDGVPVASGDAADDAATGRAPTARPQIPRRTNAVGAIPAPPRHRAGTPHVDPASWRTTVAMIQHERAVKF